MDSESQPFESVQLTRERLHEQIADSIQEMITSGQILVGERLPPERELAKLLDVNRSTVREAIRLLHQRGLVEMKSGSGTYITKVPTSIVGEAIERLYISHDCSYEDLVALRSILEPGIAALAAIKAEPEDLERLDRSLQRLDSLWYSMDCIEDLVAADTDFHMALAVASHNELLHAIFNGIRMVMGRWLKTTSRQVFENVDREEMTRRLHHHRDLYDAILARDPVRAREAMLAQVATWYGDKEETLLREHLTV